MFCRIGTAPTIAYCHVSPAKARPWASVTERLRKRSRLQRELLPWQITTTRSCYYIPFAKFATAKLVGPPLHSSIQKTARLFVFSAASVADLFGVEMIKAASVGVILTPTAN